MKLFYNNQEIFELQEWQKKVIKNDIPSSIFENDMTRRCKYWLESPCEKYVHANKDKFVKELRDSGHPTIPTDLVKLGSKLVDTHKASLKLSGADKGVSCRVGDQTFELSSDHRKIRREMHKERYANMQDAEIVSEEEKENTERMAWILKHKFERCMERLRNEWTPRLAAKGLTEVPSDDQEFANLVFSQPDYKDREKRDAEAEAAIRAGN